MHLIGTMRGLAALVAGGMMSLVAAAPDDAMPVAQQNALVKKHCVVCHTDAGRSGGLSLEHFDARNPDPGVAAMMLGKLRTGAIGAAGVKLPDEATIQAWIRATTAEATGADKWTVTQKNSLTTAGIVRELPGAGGVPDSYRLSLTCRADTHEGAIELSWSPGVPKEGQSLAVFLDGRSVSGNEIGGPEPMGGGMAGVSGPGSVVLKLGMGLPIHWLTIHDVFPNEKIEFPFDELSSVQRQTLSACFPAR